MNGVHSKNPRIHGIIIANHGCDECVVCGKNRSKRKGKRPAPINFCFEFTGANFRNNFAKDNPRVIPGPAQVGVAKCLAETGWELARRLRIGGDLCLGCAKRLSSRLDAVIDQIEAAYR